MPSIINGLFSGRSGISSHGSAIAVVGDNISNSSTVGYKTSRAEFQDLIAGGQTSNKVIGSGSAISAVSMIFQQGTMEDTGRPLDMAVDGNGLFVLANGAQRYYTRAGNFKVDEEGFVVNQNGYKVLGFPSGGSGALEPLSVNQVSQSQVATTTVAIAGNLNASSDLMVGAIPTTSTAAAASAAANIGTLSSTTYAQLNAKAEFSTVVDVFDTLGTKHTLTNFFYHTGAGQYTVKSYANSEEVDNPAAAGTHVTGVPRQVGSLVMNFGGDGSRAGYVEGSVDFSSSVDWADGADVTSVSFTLSPFTQFSSASNIVSITQDGKGIGTVGSVSIEKNGNMYALLNNGQSSIIGTVGLVNFANPEGLIRIGGTILQQSPNSGEPVVGKPKTGTFGAIQSGSLELSTVDIANEFVKLITLQRGFQANSRIITTINQLLNDIIQLA